MSLRKKWVVYITIVIILLASALSFFFIRQQKTSEKENLIRYGLTLVNNLAYNSEYGVLIANKEILLALIQGVMRERDVIYCIIQDKDGNTLASSGMREEDVAIKGLDRKISDVNESIVRFYISKEGFRIYEVTAPIFSEISEGFDAELGFFMSDERSAKFVKIGVARVGISMASANVRMAKAQKIAILTTLILILIGVAVTCFLVGAIVTPIDRLAEGTRKIAAGDLDFRVFINTKDEIGDLGIAFNKMTDDLRLSRDRLIKNIAELKKAEEETKRASQMTHNILEKAPFGIYVVNSEGNIDYANPTMVNISGITYEQFKNLNVFGLPTYKEIGLDEKIKKALNGVAFYMGPVEYTAYISNKRTIRNFTGIPLIEAGNRKVLIFVEDVTELKKVQFQLIQAEKMETVGRLASGIAHEVKNPLAIILQCVEYLVKNVSSQDKNVSLTLEYIRDSVRKADNVVRGLLDFSGTSKLDIKIYPLNPVIERALLLLKHQFDRYHIKIIKDLKGDLPFIEIDENRIEQVFVNLFLNAVAAMPKGGHLTVRSYYEKEKESVVVNIEDTGIGIPEEILEKIFEPFFTTRRSLGGTGLGLSVVKNIIDLHSGKILVQNRKEGGVEVNLVFKVKIKGGRYNDEEKNYDCRRRSGFWSNGEVKS
jgi:PAS domain S-box-containing protein